VLAPFWDAGSAQVLSSVAFRLLCFAGGIAVSSEADILFLPFGCDCGATGGSFSLPTLACLSCAIRSRTWAIWWKAMRELGEEIWYADISVKDVGPDSDVMGLALTWLDFA
jgi:hypothetical protein